MADNFTKLFASLTDSTIWAEDDHTRIVWITMLAMADEKGYVGASVPGLANRARVPIESVERALNKFLAPDPYSRSAEHGGRRIEVAERGWNLLNYRKFRLARNDAARREYRREWMREHRVNKREQCEPGVNANERLRTKAEAEAEAEGEEDKDKDTEKDPERPLRGAPGKPPVLSVSSSLGSEGYAQALRTYETAFARRYGKRPIVTPGEKGQLGRSLQSWPDGIDSFLTAVRAFVADDDPWLLARVHSLLHLQSRLNRYRVESQAGTRKLAPVTEHNLRVAEEYLARKKGEPQL